MDQNLSPKDVESLQRALHTKIYPGTELMLDIDGHHFVHGTSGAHSVLVPQPSDDKHDPLNWSPRWKGITLFCSTLVTFTQAFAPLALAPIFPYLMQEFDATLAEAIQFTGVTILLLGFSNFFWVPFMTTFGRRPTLILSMCVCLASSVWRAEARSYSAFFGACILNGFGAGPSESAQPAIITDVVFLHDRGKYNTLYFAFYFGSTSVGPIIAGVMAQALGWRSFWWLTTAMNLFTLLCCIFLFPETMYQGPNPSKQADGQSDSGVTQVLDERVRDPLVNHREVDGAVSDTIGAGGKATAPPKHAPSTTEKTLPEPSSTPASSSLGSLQDPYLGCGSPNRQQWLPSQIPPLRTLPRLLAIQFMLPWYLHIFPIVEFAAFVVSFTASCQLTTNLTQSQVFGAPPYNFTPQTIGFFNFAILAGEIIGLCAAGPLSDWVASVLTKRNGGIREPEMRLLAMIPFVLVMIFANFIVAFGSQHGWDWRIIVILGYTAAGLTVTTLPAIASTYAVDSYKPVTGSIFVAITVNKNLWGYGVSNFITSWIEKRGYVEPIMVNMCLTTLWCVGGGVGFWYAGKWCRGVTKKSFVHKL